MSNGPQQTTHSKIDVDGARLAWTESGPASGRPVLLVHGFPLHGGIWEQQRSSLAKTHRVIVPDLRGYGRSTLGDWPSESPSLARYADDLALLLDHGGYESVAFVGFSMGGYIALEMLRRHPQRVAALAMVDSRVVADDETARAGRLKMAAKAAEWGSERIAGMMRPKLLATNATPEAVQATIDQIASADPATIAASQLAMATRPDSTATLNAYDGPLLAIAGEHDEISPPDEMRAFSQSAKHGTFVQIDGAGHMTPVESPEELTAALEEWIQANP